MKNKLRLAGLTVFAVLALLGVMPAANAGSDFTCPGTNAGVVNGNLVVPPSGFCVFGPGTVTGNVIALQDSILLIHDVTVGGNIEGHDADAVWVFAGAVPNRIAGNIHIVGGGPSLSFFHEVNICKTTVEHGNIQIEKRTGSILVGTSCGPNRVERGGIKVEDNNITTSPAVDPVGPNSMEILFNTMAWNLQVFKNRGAGNKFVQSNTHLGALQCKENSPPFFGGPNNGPGPDDRGDQCFDVVP